MDFQGNHGLPNHAITITEDWVFESNVLETGHVEVKHTAANLASELKRVVEEWYIADKVICVIKDNARNIKKAAKLQKWNRLSCFAHTLNLIVTNALKQVPDLEDVIQSVKNIVCFFHKSSKASDKLKVIQESLDISIHKLIQHVETRWNSVFYMLERYLEQQEAIRTTLCLLDRNDLNIPADKTSLLEDTVTMLRPFEQVTRENFRRKVCVHL